MNSIADTAVILHTSSRSVPATPCWFGEVTLIIEHLRQQGVLMAIEERVHFARRRFGHYDVLDCVVVLFGDAISRERTLQVFYERLRPFAGPFMALFGRNRLPEASTLSRFLAALTPPATEALRRRFLDDLLARPLNHERMIGGLVDRVGQEGIVIDSDGTREAARQRALPQTDDRPTLHRRWEQVCAPGSTGRKRGEVVRTRTTVAQAHTSPWLGTFGNPGNGPYRDELRQAVEVIRRYCQAHGVSSERVVLRWDGQ